MCETLAALGALPGGLVDLALLVTSVGFVALAGSAIWLARRARLRVRHDLRTLSEVHVRAERNAIEVPEVSVEAVGALCLNCGATYLARLLVCPECGRSAGA